MPAGLLMATIGKNPFEQLWFLCLAIDHLSLTYHSVHNEEQLTMRGGYKNNNGKNRANR